MTVRLNLEHPKIWRALFCAVLLALSAACSDQSGTTGNVSAETDGRFRQALANLEIKTDEVSSGGAKLQDGYFEEPAAPGSASKTTIQITSEAFGDLNADGADDAAVILATSSGGSGTFYYLAVAINQEGAAEHVGTEFLGDRVEIESVNISAGVISVSFLSHETGQPMSEPPASRRNLSFVVSDGRLEKQE